MQICVYANISLCVCLYVLLGVYSTMYLKGGVLLFFSKLESRPSMYNPIYRTICVLQIFSCQRDKAKEEKTIFLLFHSYNAWSQNEPKECFYDLLSFFQQTQMAVSVIGGLLTLINSENKCIL